MFNAGPARGEDIGAYRGDPRYNASAEGRVGFLRRFADPAACRLGRACFVEPRTK
jgi:hypothetical protein